jgi:phage shock protein A
MNQQTAMSKAQSTFDNMAEPEGTESDELRECIAMAEEYIGRAERALLAGDTAAARDLMKSAADCLVDE